MGSGNDGVERFGLAWRIEWRVEKSRMMSKMVMLRLINTSITLASLGSVCSQCSFFSNACKLFVKTEVSRLVYPSI